MAMFKRKDLFGLGLGSLISISGLISILSQGSALNDLELAIKVGPGYLFLISGLVVILVSVLVMQAEKKDGEG